MIAPTSSRTTIRVTVLRRLGGRTGMPGPTELVALTCTSGPGPGRSVLRYGDRLRRRGGAVRDDDVRIVGREPHDRHDLARAGQPAVGAMHAHAVRHRVRGNVGCG